MNVPLSRTFSSSCCLLYVYDSFAKSATRVRRWTLDLPRTRRSSWNVRRKSRRLPREGGQSPVPFSRNVCEPCVTDSMCRHAYETLDMTVLRCFLSPSSVATTPTCSGYVHAGRSVATSCMYLRRYVHPYPYSLDPRSMQHACMQFFHWKRNSLTSSFSSVRPSTPAVDTIPRKNPTRKMGKHT